MRQIILRQLGSLVLIKSYGFNASSRTFTGFKFGTSVEELHKGMRRVVVYTACRGHCTNIFLFWYGAGDLLPPSRVQFEQIASQEFGS